MNRWAVNRNQAHRDVPPSLWPEILAVLAEGVLLAVVGMALIALVLLAGTGS